VRRPGIKCGLFLLSTVAIFRGMHQNVIPVILGPGAELHTGIHDELIDTPPLASPI
jgi:hypothetical protein